jgi:leucyl aminopeptidase
MTLKFSLTDARPAAAAFDAVVVGVFEEKTMSSAAAELDEASGGALKRLLDSGDLSGKIGQAQKLYGLSGIKAARVVVVGLGEQERFDPARYGRAAAEGAKALKGGPGRTAASYLPELDVAGKDVNWKARIAALAADRENYRYTATLKQKNGGGLAEIAFFAPGAGRGVADAQAIAAGVELARELGNLPPNVCNPAYVAPRDAGSRTANRNSAARCSGERRCRNSAWARCSRSRAAARTSRSWSCCATRARPRATHPTCWSARASRSTRAASRSSPARAWRR